LLHQGFFGNGIIVLVKIEFERIGIFGIRDAAMRGLSPTLPEDHGRQDDSCAGDSPNVPPDLTQPPSPGGRPGTPRVDSRCPQLHIAEILPPEFCGLFRWRGKPVERAQVLKFLTFEEMLGTCRPAMFDMIIQSGFQSRIQPAPDVIGQERLHFRTFHVDTSSEKGLSMTFSFFRP